MRFTAKQDAYFNGIFSQWHTEFRWKLVLTVYMEQFFEAFFEKSQVLIEKYEFYGF